MFGGIQYQILKKLSPAGPSHMDGSAYAGKSKAQVLIGQRFIDQFQGKTVIDFGCGEGHEAIELVRLGAGKVIGVDIREDILAVARRNAQNAGVSGVCEFTSKPDTKADVIVSLDAFEHFEDPAEILRIMASVLQPNGEVIAVFGPTWYHPYGGHLFSVFPWAHLLFTEEALIRWRSDFKTDGATRFSEVAGGLNQMTLSRFERVVAASPFEVGELEAVPIRKLTSVHNSLTREFTTASVRCRLVKRRD